MKTADYNLSAAPRLLSHYPSDTLVLRDYTNPDYRKRLDDHAQSGDYLINLAAELDHIAIELRKGRPKAAKSLIKLARDLSYIDYKYKIIKKPKDESDDSS